MVNERSSKQAQSENLLMQQCQNIETILKNNDFCWESLNHAPRLSFVHFIVWLGITILDTSLSQIGEIEYLIWIISVVFI